MDRYYLYILGNSKGRHYIGITEDVQVRLDQHNAGKVKSTKAYRPWKVLHTEDYASKTNARKRELHLKKNFRARQDLYDHIARGNGPIV